METLLDGLSYAAHHYGDIASVLGLAVSVVGFIYTLRQVKKATRAAQQAAREAVARVGSQLLESDLGDSHHLLRESREACRLKHWS